MPRLLVTGSEGFIGRPLVKYLRQTGYEVFTLDLHGAGDKHFNIDIVDGDLELLLNSIKPDAVIHLAAQVIVADSFVDPIRDLEVNGKGTARLVISAINSGCKNFIYVGSGGAIYDSSEPMPLTELSRLRPVSPYGLTKNLGEGYVRVLSEAAGNSWTSLALSNCYGPVFEHGRGVIFQFWKALSEQRTPFINGENVTRDFVYIDDVVRAIAMSIDVPTNQRVNISSGLEISLLQLYELIARIMGSHVKPDIKSPLIGDVLRSCLSNDRAKEFLGWLPEVDLETGLKLSFGLKANS